MHTTSLEVSKKLKEAGCEIESKLGWYIGGYAPFIVEIKPENKHLHKQIIPAYTLGELFRELPEGYAISLKEGKAFVHNLNGLIQIDQESFNGELSMELQGWVNQLIEIDTPEDACALVWIALREQK